MEYLNPRGARVVALEKPTEFERGQAATIALGVLQTAIATLIMFALVRRQGASFCSQINFLVPLFGVMWGAMILAERPSTNAYLALVLILIGIAVVRGRGDARDVRRSV